MKWTAGSIPDQGGRVAVVTGANSGLGLVTARELARAGEHGRPPGWAATNLQSAAAPLADRLLMKVGNLVIAQNEEMGALPTLYAATEPGLPGGTYAGPDGIGEQRGHPHVVSPSGAARDEATAQRLWEVSEELTGVHFELGAAAA